MSTGAPRALDGVPGGALPTDARPLASTGEGRWPRGWGGVRRAAALMAGLACAVALVAVGWWAGRTALEPPADPLAALAPVSIEVVAGRVGRTLPLSALAQWPAAVRYGHRQEE